VGQHLKKLGEKHLECSKTALNHGRSPISSGNWSEYAGWLGEDKENVNTCKNTAEKSLPHNTSPYLPHIETKIGGERQKKGRTCFVRGFQKNRHN